MTAELEWNEKDQRLVDTIRVLAADAVEKAGHGHPGTAMSIAPLAYLLFQKIMKHDPADPNWAGRDRFILSPGHSSLTLYLQLFLAGYGLEMKDIEALRTKGSLTPGHPEYGHTAGVEMTTGPLGQGLASSVGFAYAQRRTRGLYDAANTGESLFDHHVYVIASDGDIQEGVTSEASSLAGHQGLGNLIVIWDNNNISIEDDTDVAFTEDVIARYEAYGWHTQSVDWTVTGQYKEDVRGLYKAIEKAKAVTDKPSFISLRTIIGWPAPKKQNTGGIHGSKLGAEELAAVKKELGFDPHESFHIDADLLSYAREAQSRGAEAHAQWDAEFQKWAQKNPEQLEIFNRVQHHQLPAELDEALPVFEAGTEIATRAASGQVLTAVGAVMPELWGGSADLAGSNNTTIEGASSFNPEKWSTKNWKADPYGRVLHFGIREHAAAAIVNGIILSSKTRAFSGTFLIFSDYQRPAVRLSALMKVPSIYVWTHDSIGLGEDGPTHQPIEQLSALRAIPGFDVVRPADGNEVAYAWKGILGATEHPAGIVLSRQNLPVLDRTKYASAEGTLKGAYILAEAQKGGKDTAPDVILIATGSEVQHALGARDLLAEESIAARVVSMPSMEWFERQDTAYQEEVLPADITARVSVEAGSAMSWYRLLGSQGRAVAVDHYGESASAEELFADYGFTAENVAAKARDSIAAGK